MTLLFESLRSQLLIIIKATSSPALAAVAAWGNSSHFQSATAFH